MLQNLDEVRVLLITSFPFIGSFVATAIARGSNAGDIYLARSHCDHCQAKLPIRDLVPIASWMILRGKCRFCRSRVSIYYLLVELSFLITGLWVACNVEVERAVAAYFLACLLLSLAISDLRLLKLPNVLNLILLLAGIASAYVGGVPSVIEALTGACLGALSLFLVAAAYRFITSREGLGMGDVKLFGAAGAWVGVGGLPSMLFIGSSVTLLASIFIIKTSDRFQKLPLGAGLALGLWVTWLYGPLL